MVATGPATRLVTTALTSTQARYAPWYAGNCPRWNHRRSEKRGRISPNAAAQFRNSLISRDPRQHWACGQSGGNSLAEFLNYLPELSRAVQILPTPWG